MIGFLYGKLEERRDEYVVLNVGDVGYKVFVSRETLGGLPALGIPLKLYTYLYVRENELDLYGFSTEDELDMFELLIGISGIGPKGALSVLSVASPKDLRIAILSENDKLLTKVSGIGKKTAQKIILELKGKVEKLRGEEREFAPDELSQRHDAIDALVALGYSQRDAREALAEVPEEVKDVEERVRGALKILGKNRK